MKQGHIDGLSTNVTTTSSINVPFWRLIAVSIRNSTFVACNIIIIAKITEENEYIGTGTTFINQF